MNPHSDVRRLAERGLAVLLSILRAVVLVQIGVSANEGLAAAPVPWLYGLVASTGVWTGRVNHPTPLP